MLHVHNDKLLHTHTHTNQENVLRQYAQRYTFAVCRCPHWPAVLEVVKGGEGKPHFSHTSPQLRGRNILSHHCRETELEREKDGWERVMCAGVL